MALLSVCRRSACRGLAGNTRTGTLFPVREEVFPFFPEGEHRVIIDPFESTNLCALGRQRREPPAHRFCASYSRAFAVSPDSDSFGEGWNR